jgi:hypothetical protein
MFKWGTFHLALHVCEGSFVGADRKLTFELFFALHRKTLRVSLCRTTELLHGVMRMRSTCVLWCY